MNPEIVRALATLEADPENVDALAALAQLTEGGGNGHGRGGSPENGETAVRRALGEARRVHRERGDFELVVRLIDLELGIEPDKDRRADLYYEKGKLLNDELLREGDAVRAFERVLELRPDDDGTKDTLGHIALVRDNWQKIVQKYLEEAKSSTDRQLTTSLFQSVAEIYAKYQPDENIEKYLKRALEVEPRNAKASARLEKLYRGEQRWADLAEVLAQRVDAVANKEERVLANLALAEVLRDKVGRREDAVEAFKRALGLDPANPRALSALVDYYTAQEDWQALIRVYESALKARPRGEPETAMQLQIGMLWWKKLGNLESADEYWKKVRKADPAHPAMLEFYRAYYAAPSEAQKLVGVLQQAHKVESDPKRRLELGVEMAEAASASAGAAEKAIDLWKAVQKQDPENPRATAALTRLYQKTEKWNALLEMLKESVEALPKDAVEERVAKLDEVVAIYRDKLHLDVMVINTYNQILALKPDHEAALAALAGKYESLGRWNDLISVLSRTVEVARDKDERARLLRRIASLWIDKFSNHNQAVRPLEELYALDPNDRDAVGKLQDIYTKRRSWRALIDLEKKELERVAGQEGTRAEQRQKLGEMAKLAADRLGDAREAIAVWNRVLADWPDDAEALSMLASLYERDRRWPALIEIVRRQASAKDLEPKQRVVLLEKIGTAFVERLDNPDKAAEVYRQILEVMPSHQKATRTLRELYAAAGRYGDLEALYRASGQIEELCDILTATAERIEERAQKVALYERVAAIAEGELKSPDKAARAFERVLSIDPENEAAAAALVPIYRAQEKWARLLATQEIILGALAKKASPPIDKMLALYGEIIALCDEKLGSKSLAFAWAQKAYRLEPSDGARALLERLAAEAEAWEELSEVYQGEAAAETDDQKKAERYRKLARISLTHLRRADEGQKFFEEVLRRAPEDAEALASLEQIHTQAGNYKELLEVYRKREGRASDAQLRLDILFKQAWIEEEKLGDPVAAIATYRRVLETDKSTPAQTRALRALEKLEAARGNAPGLAETLKRQLALLPPAESDTRVELMNRLGELHELNLDDPAGALSYYRDAFALAPGTHKSTVTALERWLKPGHGDADRVAVARLLAPVYEQRLAMGERGAAAKLIDTLEIVRAGEKDEKAELALLPRLLELAASELGDAKRAYGYGARLFEKQPGDRENRRRMGLLADQIDQADDWAVRLADAETAARGRGDTALAQALAWDLGQLFEQRLGMPNDAEAAYTRILGSDAGNVDAEEALMQLYRSHERFSDLRALLEKKKERTGDGEKRLQLLLQICDLDEGVLDDRKAAARDYAEVLKLDPASQRAFRALERLYGNEQSWQALDKLYADRIPFAPASGDGAESRAQLLFRRAELHASRLADDKGAADLYEEALDADAGHEGARRGLEALMKQPALRQRIARSLEPLYRADEAWPKLALVLGARREASDLSAAEATALAAQLATLQEEKLGARQLALATWREALRLDPADGNVRDNVERLATLLGRKSELASAWEEAFTAAPRADLGLRGELLSRAAVLYESELHDVDKARDTWRRLFDLDPTNLATARPAATALARLYEQAEDWPALIEVLHRQSDWAESSAEKKELLFRIGRIEEELLVDPAAATRTYREILDEDPAEEGALAQLEKLHEAKGQWPELADILRRRLDRTQPGQAGRRELLWRIAQLNERELRDPGEAIAQYHAILEEAADDLPALDALGRLYEAEKRPADLLEIVERRLELADKKGEKSESQRLRLQVAGLLDGFSRRQEALERYAEVLTIEPKNAPARAGIERYLSDPELRLRAAEVLEPHYQAAAELDKQVKLAELWAEHAPDPKERIGRLSQIARLKESAGDADAAFDAISKAARLSLGEPELPELLDEIERLTTPSSRSRLVALYRELGPDILDAALQERVYLQVAGESNKLGDQKTAREYYRRVLDMAPDHPKALDALESIYEAGREWESLYEIYARRAELAGGDGERRRHYLVNIAELCGEDKLDRPMEAIAAYEQVLELYPNDATAYGELEVRYLAAHRHADLADLIEKKLGFCEDVDEAVALRFRLGRLYDEDLADPERAVENYRAALGGDPMHAAAIAALEKFLDDDSQRVGAAEVLEPTYVARHDWPALVRIYKIRLEGADDERTRQSLTRRIARLYEEQLENLEEAFTWYARLFKEEPAATATRDQLARLAGILDGWGKLAEVYEDYVADVGPEGPEAGEVLRALASIYHARLEDVDRAKAAYERLLALDPSDDSAFRSLEQLLVRNQRHRDLLAVYEDAAENSLVPARRKELYIKQANLRERDLDDADGAIDSFRAVLDLDGNDEEALIALDRLYTQKKRWHDLVELILRRLPETEVESAAWRALKLRLGGIYENDLEDRPAAIDAYEEVLKAVPADPQALSALERLIVDHDHTYRIAQILEPIYLHTDAWQKLVVIYDAELEFIDDKARRVERLLEIARIHEERGGDVRLAFAALSRAWKEEAADPEAGEREAALYKELYRLGKRLRAFADLVQVLRAAVVDSYDYDLKARVFARIADIEEKELGDRGAAIASWQKVVEVRDDSVDAYKALERLLADEGRNRELVQILDKRASLSNEVDEQKRLAHQAAALYEGALADPDQAITTWRHALSLDESDGAALDALERLYAQKGAHRDLSLVLTQKIEQTRDPAAQRPLRQKLAELFETSLHDTMSAIDAYKGILEHDAADVEALEATARLYAKEGLHADHLEAVDALAAAAAKRGDHARKVELDFKAAEVLLHEVGDAERATERYRQVLFAAPEHGGQAAVGAKAALETLLRDEGAREQAAAVLEPYYEEHRDFHALIDLYELKLSGHNDPDERRRLLSRIAELNEAGVEDLQAAFAAWGRLFASDPADTRAQSELERLAELQHAPGELARVYEERLHDGFDGEVQRALALRLGDIYEHKLGDEERAIAAYNKALELTGIDGDASLPLAALDRLLGRAARFPELAGVIEKEAAAALDPNEQAELYYRLGALRAGELVDLDGALHAYRDALAQKPDHAGARAGLEKLLSSAPHARDVLEVLEPLYEADQNWEKTVELAEARLGTLDDPADQAALLERTAERCERELKSPARALEAMARALSLAPSEPRLADEVERLGAAAGDARRAADTFEAVLDGPHDLSKEGRVHMGLRTARLWETLGDQARAETRYLYVLDLERENADALTALERAYRASGANDKLAPILERRADAELDVGDKKRFFGEAATLRERGLDDVPGAIAGWRKVLEVDDADETALDALARLLESQSSYVELVEVLHQKLRFSADGEAQVTLRQKVAEIWADKVGDLDRAAEAYRDLCDHAPGSLPALAALEEIERRRGDFTAVQEVLVQTLSAVGGGAAQVPIYKKLARLAIDNHDATDDAIGYLHEILQIAPDDHEANGELMALLEKTERYHDLIDVLSEQANRRAQAGDGPGEIALLVRAADVWEGRLNNPEASTEILERILERDPKNVRALMSLARIYEGAHDNGKAVETLERAIALADGSHEGKKARAELYFRLGKIVADDQGEEAAEPHWQSALDDDPAHTGALAALEKLMRGRGDWDNVAALVEKRIGATPDEEKKPLYLELADLYGNKLNRAADALPHLETLARLAPDDNAIAERLADLYLAAGRADAALPIYQGLAERLGKGRKTRELSRLYQRIAAIAEKKGDAVLAMEQYQAAFQIDPQDGATMIALGRLYLGAKEWEKARRIYRSMLLSNLDPKLGVGKADVYLHLGFIHEQLGEGPKAVGMYERGLELDGGHAALKSALAKLKS